MTPEEKYELFEKHTNQSLSDAEQQLLDQLLKEQPETMEELKVYGEMHSHLESSLGNQEKRSQFEANLQQVGDAYFNEDAKPQKNKVITLPRWTYAVAASVAIILSLYIFNNRPPSYDEVVMIPEISISQRSFNEELVKAAETSFNAKSYKDAVKNFQKLLFYNPDNAEFMYYYGIALVESAQSVEATKVFAQLASGSSAYKFKAIWFEALHQLKLDNQKQTVSLLKTIPEEAEVYHQAQELLKKLD